MWYVIRMLRCSPSHAQTTECGTAQAVCRECAWRLREDDEGVTCERRGEDEELDPCSRWFRDEVCWTNLQPSAQCGRVVSCLPDKLTVAARHTSGHVI